MKTLLSVIAVLSLGCCAAYACGATDICNDVSSSLSGVVISTDGVITWSTDDENGEVTSYSLHRYDCGNPATCLVSVATIYPRGNCAQNEEYTYTDAPSPGDPEDWTYRLRVFKNSTIQACEYDVDPQ